MQDKMQREREVAAKKLAQQKAKEAKQLQKEAQNKLKQAKQLKRNQNKTILITEEVDIDAIQGRGDGIAKTAVERPQRIKRLPRNLDGYQIDIE